MCVYNPGRLFLCADSLKHRYHKYIKLFLTTWNQLRVSLMTNGKQLLTVLSASCNPLPTVPLEVTCFIIQGRLRSRLSTVKRTWTSTATSRCSYLGDEARGCAPQRLSATSSLCTMTWCTVWTNTLERRPGGGAHTSFLGCSQAA